MHKRVHVYVSAVNGAGDFKYQSTIDNIVACVHSAGLVCMHIILYPYRYEGEDN